MANALQDTMSSLGGNLGNLALAQNVDFNTLLGFALGRYLKGRYDAARNRRLEDMWNKQANGAMANNIGSMGNSALTVASGGNTPENQWRAATLYQTVNGMKPTTKAGAQLKQGLFGPVQQAYNASLTPRQQLDNEMAAKAVAANPTYTPEGRLFQAEMDKRLNPYGYGVGLTNMMY